MSIQLSDLLPGATNCIKNVAKIQPGEEVLILSDTSVNSDVVDAYKIAAEMAGGKVSVLTLKCEIAGASPLEILEQGYFVPWPKMAWHAMIASDVTLNLSYYIEVHSLFGAGQGIYVDTFMDLIEKYGVRLVRVQIGMKEMLANKSYALFPEGLLQFLMKTSYDILTEATKGDMDHAKVRITDVEGTDLSFEGFAWMTSWRVGGEKDEGKASDKEATPSAPFLKDRKSPWKTFGSCNVGFQPALPTSNANGVVVSSALHTGPIPRLKITVKDGQAVDIEGGGEVGAKWRRVWEKGKNFSSIGRYIMDHPKPGVNWMEECMYGVHPKAFGLGKAYMFQGTEADHSWFPGDRRSGTFHISFGGGIGKEYQHNDIDFFFPTLTVNDIVIIDKGHLLALDDPRVRKEAEKYGDTDELLTEAWVPDWIPEAQAF